MTVGQAPTTQRSDIMDSPLTLATFVKKPWLANLFASHGFKVNRPGSLDQFLT